MDCKAIPRPNIKCAIYVSSNSLRNKQSHRAIVGHVLVEIKWSSLKTRKVEHERSAGDQQAVVSRNPIEYILDRERSEDDPHYSCGDVHTSFAEACNKTDAKR